MILTQQADRVKPLIYQFAVNHMVGILESCTEGSDETGRWRVARDIVGCMLEGGKAYHLACQVIRTKALTFNQPDALERAGNEVFWDHDHTRRIIGRAIWDTCYQRGKRMIPWKITMH